MNHWDIWIAMSGIFLTEKVPMYLLEEDDGSFDALDDFIRDHTIDALSSVETGEILELIDDATSIAIHAMRSKE